MFLFLAIYFNFFNKNQECLPILELLGDPAFLKRLNINDAEILYYRMISSKPKNANKKEELEWVFSKQVVEKGSGFDDRRHTVS